MIQIFPNPIQDELNIINANGELILYNSIGQRLKQVNITETTFQLNTNDLKIGTYFLIINKNDGSSFSKTIIK
ncbi:MAG: T9SS type A sorting domain-containing protein [Saprospiraceae bacterium]